MSNGGPTQTNALDPASVAKDLIPPADCTDAGGVNPLLSDQRGVERPFNGNCDSGAYELATCASQTVDGAWTVGTAGNDGVNGTAAVEQDRRRSGG